MPGTHGHLYAFVDPASSRHHPASSSSAESGAAFPAAVHFAPR